MHMRHVEQTALTTFVLAASLMFFIAVYAAIANAQNPSNSVTVPQRAEQAVSPTTPGTLPGTQAGPGTSVGTNPITGQPCLGGGGSAITGGIPNAPTAANQPDQANPGINGLPPDNSVYGLNNQLNSTSNPGAC